MIKDFFIAVLLTILLNINTLIGFAEVYLTNQLVYPNFLRMFFLIQLILILVIILIPV